MTHATQKIVLAGGSGFLGQLLSQWFGDRGWDVVVLSRQPGQIAGSAKKVAWDGTTLGEWHSELDGARAVVNVAGRSVNCHYHAANRRAILLSRINSTRVLGEAVSRCANPPSVWLNSSTATIYKHTLGPPWDEATGVIDATPEAKDEFSIEVARAWERVFEETAVPRTRKVALRTAMVFGTTSGTVFRALRRLARCGLGGAMAGGGQYVSWIHQTDFCRAVEWLIAHEDFSGPVNLTAPQPLTNREMMRLVREACGARFGMPAARWMLEIGAAFLRTETELIIKSRRVVPRRLLESGFEFCFPHLQSAVTDLEQQLADGPGATCVTQNPLPPTALPQEERGEPVRADSAGR